MDEIRYFVPGDDDGGHDPAAEFLPRLRWPVPAGVGRTYVSAYARPGERVLVPYCQGPGLVREILAAGRVPLALNFDPLLVLLSQVALDPPPPRELDAAVARLGDSLKRGVPLRRYLGDLYATTCPACLRPAVADYFIWDRDLAEPVAKYVRCPSCAWDGRTAVDVEDRERLAGVEPRGVHYHYLLDRIAPEGGRGLPRPRLEQLLELYSPRNLYALAELTIKIDSLFVAGPLRRALSLLLVDCLDRCSSLAPLPGSDRRRERLRLARPSRYLERNAWLAFEHAAARLHDLAKAGPAPHLAAGLEALSPAGGPQASEEPKDPGEPQAPDEPRPAGVLAHGLVRDLPRGVPPRSLRLVLTSPPPLEPAAWSLSYLWGAWALGAGAVTALLPLLRQRGADPAWYARVMAGSLATLSDLLRDDGRIVLVLEDQSTAVVEALLLAAAAARLGLAALTQCGADYRLELAPAVAPAVAPSGEPLEDQVRRGALEAACDALRARGEPARRRVLHAAAHARLAHDGLLRRALDDRGNGPPALDLVAAGVQQALEDPALTPLAPAGGEPIYWLADPAAIDPPLSDRVEVRAHQILQEASAQPLSETEFARRLYAAFPGPLAPGRDLVAACLRAYGRPAEEGGWALRPEDAPAAREAERLGIIEQILALGRRLGYHTTPRPPFDAAWLEGGAVRGLFLVRWHANVGHLPPLPAGAAATAAAPRPYLVIPGGRAALLSHKLAHNPLWQRAVDDAGWRFIKYRHVRQLAAQGEVDEYQLRTIVGLDPIVERESAQIPLF
jgi:hypothetical protein